MSSSVAIVTPCHNDGRYLLDALASVRRQDYPDVTHIVVDDGSTELVTLEVLEAATRLGVTVLRQEQSGVVAARNHGINHASADYILSLDADDRIEPSYVRRAAMLLDADPGLGLVYCLADQFDDSGKYWAWNLPPFSLEQEIVTNVIHACVMFRRVDWQTAGGYPPLRLDDYGMWLAIIGLGRTVTRIDDVLYHYRQTPGSITHRMTEEDSVHALAEVYRAYPQLFLANLEAVIRDHRRTMQRLRYLQHRYGRVEDLIHGAAERMKRVRRSAASLFGSTFTEGH